MTWLYTNEWAAGFFDGEGCVTVEMRPNKKPGNLIAQVTQKSVEPLRQLQNVWGGSIGPVRDDGTHRWRLSAREAESFLEAIRASCIVKRSQIDLALAYQKTIGKTGQRLTSDVMQTRNSLVMELSREKRNWSK